MDPLPPRWTERYYSIYFDKIGAGDCFCQGLQAYSPINSHVSPIPSGLPGYADAVIMAAGTFIQGASIEISADAPIEPYTVYLQGGMVFAHSVWALQSALQRVQKVGRGEDSVVK